VKIVTKPWGQELWFAHTDKYAGKIFTVKKGCRLSLAYHKRKHETLYVSQGVVDFTLEDENGVLKKMILRAGEMVEVIPGKRHRVAAIENCQIFEVSTPQLNDEVRVEDDYGRV